MPPPFERVIELRPLRDPIKEISKLESRIIAHIKKFIFDPILDILELKEARLLNSGGDFPFLEKALGQGKVTYSGGAFRGRFSAPVTRELKAIGARWDKKLKVFFLAQSQIPVGLESVLFAGQNLFKEQLQKINTKLSQILPEEIAEAINFSDIFDQTIWQTEKEFSKTIKGLAIAPDLTSERQRTLAEEWSDNMKLWIRDFSETEIKRLRRSVEKNAMAGFRFENLTKSIQAQYQVSHRKAAFLARQETKLLLSKYTASRYQDAGLDHYRWQCVIGSPNHPVRDTHKALNGKVFRFSDPPITSEDGRRNNPGEDYNCRCKAVPLVNYRG